MCFHAIGGKSLKGLRSVLLELKIKYFRFADIEEQRCIDGTHLIHIEPQYNFNWSAYLIPMKVFRKAIVKSI